ncbi:LADA_0E13278g1_1 [Lachancea dasiensis]|uniref:LADA_0E13278g1_1 n=1 Tax=Lachancea dasiensis TaxID=1072105 RepID=A0A1G4JFK8_9SACH|nr:LADA_0E13278g1_1 [Lachancea dasiensis]
MTSEFTTTEKNELFRCLEDWSNKPVHVHSSPSVEGVSSSETEIITDPMARDKQNEADSRSIFVRNLPIHVTPSCLSKAFKDSGTINRVTIFTKKSRGSLKSYAYIEFENVESAQRSLSFGKKVVDGHILEISKKRTNVRRYVRWSAQASSSSTRCTF